MSFAIVVPSLDSKIALFWFCNVSFSKVLAQMIKLLYVFCSFSILSFFFSIIALIVFLILSFSTLTEVVKLLIFSFNLSIIY